MSSSGDQTSAINCATGASECTGLSSWAPLVDGQGLAQAAIMTTDRRTIRRMARGHSVRSATTKARQIGPQRVWLVLTTQRGGGPSPLPRQVRDRTIQGSLRQVARLFIVRIARGRVE